MKNGTFKPLLWNLWSAFVFLFFCLFFFFFFFCRFFVCFFVCFFCFVFFFCFFFCCCCCFLFCFVFVLFFVFFIVFCFLLLFFFFVFFFFFFSQIWVWTFIGEGTLIEYSIHFVTQLHRNYCNFYLNSVSVTYFWCYLCKRYRQKEHLLPGLFVWIELWPHLIKPCS